ncbi:MAG: NADH-quinone oxidoreductase subunit C [Anaerolineae bacterium]|nr:NADH-quinone oxidoreductase subunit C [Anaerolineae bacterium]
MQIPPPLDPVEAVKRAMPDALLDAKQFRDETTLIIQASQIVKAAQYLRDTPGLVYNFLSDISAVDYYPEYNRPERFGVSYHLYSMLYNRRLRLKVFVPEEEPEVATMTTVWPGANWLEREIFDMMGIHFQGHPDMRRLLMPEDWDGHPHRRDYPLGYEQVQFSFNVEEILKHKPLAEE